MSLECFLDSTPTDIIAALIPLQIVVFKERESKRYDFEAQTVTEAAEIIDEVKKGIEPYQGMLA